jgi:sulfonate transport system permease protein
MMKKMTRRMASTIMRDSFQKLRSPDTWLFWLQNLVVPVALILFWDISVRWGWVPNTLIASPWQVVIRFREMLLSGEIIRHVLVSLWRLSVGFGVGSFLGIMVGCLVGFSRTLARLIEPTLVTFTVVPPIAWIPLIVIFLGVDDSAKIALIAIAGFCTLFIQTAYSIRTTDKELVDVGLVLEKSKLEMLFEILLPSALPDILATLRFVLTFSLSLLMASEIIASSSGLGWLIWQARNFSKPDDMIVGIIVISLVGKITDLALVKLEQYMTRWRRVYRDI